MPAAPPARRASASRSGRSRRAPPRRGGARRPRPDARSGCTSRGRPDPFHAASEKPPRSARWFRLRIGGVGPAAVPVEAQPAQIVRERVDIRPLRAGGVEVLHAEDQLPAEGAAVQPGEQHGEQIPDMQIARGARRKAPDDVRTHAPSIPDAAANANKKSGGLLSFARATAPGACDTLLLIKVGTIPDMNRRTPWIVQSSSSATRSRTGTIRRPAARRRSSGRNSATTAGPNTISPPRTTRCSPRSGSRTWC